MAERSRLMDAALKVMRLNGFQGASVQDILEEAGLSTRAFYRQFRSKDDLLLAMFRTASGRDVAAVDKAVQDAATSATSRAALDAWLDEMLAIAFDRRRMRRLVMFNVVARSTEGYDEEVAFLRNALITPLLGILTAGRADGSFPKADPGPDANALFDLVWSTVGPQARQERPMDRAGAKQHILRFCLPAFGAATRTD
jgi:AcrR family transcriptional regulator